MLTRRKSLSAIGATALLPLLGRSLAARPSVSFSYQRSSTLLTLLKADGTLDAKLASKDVTPSWHLFDDVIAPMNAGAVDFHADVADAVPIFTQSAGAPLTLYAREKGSPAAEAIIVPAASPIRAVADLRGKTVAVGRGSGCHFVLVAALKRAGLSMHDITPAYLRPTDAAAAFERGSIDAWVIWDPYLAIIESKRPTRTLCDGTGLTHYHRYYLVNTAFVQAHPDVVGIVFDALVEKGRWVKAHPEEAARRLAPIWGNLPLNVIETANSRRTYAVEPVERSELGEQQAIADAFFEAGLIPKRIDATAVPLWHPHEAKI